MTTLKALPSRLRERPILTVVGVIAVVLAIALGTTALFVGNEVDTREVFNEAGGYSLQVPEDWVDTKRGTATTVSSPDKETVLAADVGPPGPLADASALILQQVGRNYGGVQILGLQRQQIGGRAALVWAGTGTNSKNVRVRFLAITVENQPANYAMSVFTAAGSDPERVLPRVNTIVGSFRAR